ncbi:MAG: transglutaminase family protein [Myxococcota bacterium]
MKETVASLANRVERRFEASDLEVTMGGEPTFIPLQPAGDEWNQGALGPEKLGYARRLASRLLESDYPGALVMQVFGKQYPGEPLPRWVVLLLHRPEGKPLWQNPGAFLLDDVEGSHEPSESKSVMAAIANALGLEDYVLPCVKAGDSTDTVGWVLPLERRDEEWASDAWPFSQDEPVRLADGESPIGLRLPLDTLDDERLRRALTVEVKAGALHVFLPPLDLEAFVTLVGILEHVADDAGLGEIVLCGYRPESAEGLTQLGLAADPGVLEVNLPPTHTWLDYDALLTRITEAAGAEGLTTTRLHLNGQIQGTGGGAHLLFGGPTLERNPFFKRPDLLASLVRYWQQHPSLAYLFSGQYVGPGSQAPRADETQSSRLYEIETACAGVDALTDVPDRGFLDRLFRNLMTDSSGNTHRAEICLDKLWNHDSPTGLQGLVELRAFETMPEVEQQSLAALFIRAILAKLVDSPCDGTLLRFDRTLHDLYVLPAGLWLDVGRVCDDLEAAGLPFDRAWLSPLMRHRFPVLGMLPFAGGDVIVRQALEPWPLMAEISRGGSTSRMVDNSTDRLEVSVAGDLGDHRIAVNGVAVALRDVEGAQVAGVRYKSADGWPALHPHIPVQSPIHVEVVDPDDEVIAAARYHHWKPDGSNYEGVPATAEEARVRQCARWVPMPELHGKVRRVKEARYAAESHYTLDLRRQPQTS